MRKCTKKDIDNFIAFAKKLQPEKPQALKIFMSEESAKIFESNIKKIRNENKSKNTK